MPTLRTALVVGAGIAGPACALALAEAGIRTTVVEAHAGPADGAGAILTLAPTGLEAVRALGAGRAVTAEAQLIGATEMSDGAGHPFGRHDAGGLVLARDALARILAGRAAEAGITVHYGRRLVGATPHDGGITARFAGGDPVTADILIGSDGIHSVVRGLIDPGAPGPLYEGVLGFGAATDAGGMPIEPGVMHFAFGRRFLGYWRLPDGRVCWFAALPRTAELSWAGVAAVPRERWLGELRAAYAGHVPGEALLARTDPAALVATGPMLRMPPVPRWHRGRMVLVGDAVHAPSSSSGQGAALALESARELARQLRNHPDDPASAFTAYEHARRPHVEAVAAEAARANRAKAGRPAQE